MVRVVVDSDIIIDFLRSGLGRLPKLLDSQLKKEVKLYLSSITVMEIFSGQSSKSEAATIEELFSCFQVISLDTDLGKFAGVIKRDDKVTIDVPDLIIAATALYLEAKIATNNQKHFSKIPKLKFFSL